MLVIKQQIKKISYQANKYKKGTINVRNKIINKTNNIINNKANNKVKKKKKIITQFNSYYQLNFYILISIYEII